MSELDWLATITTLKLAGITTIILLALGTPLAWWLSRFESRWRVVIEALVALPLVLPPTVLGFYLLLAFSPDALPGQFWQSVTGTQLAFSFSAIVIGSLFIHCRSLFNPCKKPLNK